MKTKKLTKHMPWYLLFSVICLFFYLVSPILTPFLFSAVLAYLASPPVDYIENKGFSRTKAVFAVYVALLLIIIVTIIFLIPALSEQIREMYYLKPKIVAFFQYDLWDQINRLLPFVKTIDAEEVKETLKENVSLPTEAGSTLAEGLFGSASWLFSFFTNLALIPIVTYYFLKNYHNMIDDIYHLVPKDKRALVKQLAKESDQNLSSFLRGQFLVMNILSVFYAIGLTAMGMNYAILIGFVAGYLSFIPYIGVLIGGVIALVAAAIQFSDTLHPLMVIGIFGVAQFIEGNFLTPQLVGDKIGLDPVTVIFAIMAGGELLGITGVLIALPLSAILKVILEYIRASYEESDLYEGEPTILVEQSFDGEKNNSNEGGFKSEVQRTRI